MEIYPFKWTFKLKKLDIIEANEILLSTLTTPLIQTLRTIDMRYNQLKKNYFDLEKLYLTKLSEKEKVLYKSKFEDDENAWENTKFEKNLILVY